ncbi:MAG: hypothetical protein IBJ03_14730 [Gemmatimonadaceae bacterium]|nr:hypothetical protein [Gemmatimonadaceae bacterium]
MTLPSDSPILPQPERTVHVVSHTHWDREWYHTAARFRLRLIALVDAVLTGAGRPFLLDGQAIVLRDYLEWRPEQRNRVVSALADGSLEAGPWFVLADNLIVSGEAIVRNLEAGRRELARLGASAPPVAYCPDSFGHPAAMPMIAAGFGLGAGIVWRGLGGTAHPDGDSMRWQAPDGSELPIWHLPPDGYEYGSALPADYDTALRRWHRLRALYAERARTPVVLLPNGADHHALQPDIADAVSALAAAAATDNVRVKQSTLSQWAVDFLRHASLTGLPIVEGELRDSYGYTWTLSGTLGTRAHQKRRNARLERGLLRDVEPWMALVRLYGRQSLRMAEGGDAQLTPAHLPMLLQRAWETLLGTHPHDTLCGCSIDEVACRMESAQDDVASIGQELRERALQLVVGHDPVEARRSMHFDWRRIVIRNRAPRMRGGLARVRLVHTLADAPVGPGSASPPLPISATSAPELDTGHWMTQVLSRTVRYVRRESPQHYPDNDLALVQDTLIWIPPVPASGVALHTAQSLGHSVSAPASTVTTTHTPDSFVAANDRVQLTAHRGLDGEWRVSWRCDDREIADVLSLETQQDVGDTYTPSLRGSAETLRCREVRLISAGPLRATMRVTWTTRKRSDIRVTTDLSVSAESLVLLCNVRGHVARRDQRLQLVWRNGIPDGAVWADAAFGPVRRVRPEAPTHSREAVPAGMPMHRWATSANPLAGATLISDGLAEIDVGDGHMALTLVRSIGELSKADLPERPGHAGWPEHTPEAQCQGEFRANMGMLWHGPMNDDTRARIRDASDDVLLPLIGESWRDLTNDTIEPSCQWSGPQLSGEAFEQSAFTVSQFDSEAVILRAVNLTDREAFGAWHMPDAGPWQVTPCRLDETATGETWTSTGHIPLQASARATLTVRVRRADQPTPHPTS